jgi:hypothetical protein
MSGCPEWGLTNNYYPWKVEIGFVCMGYWNPSTTSCNICMNICYSCDKESSCNKFCYEIIPNCD